MKQTCRGACTQSEDLEAILLINSKASMSGDLNVLVAELQQLSPRLQSYAPMDPTWQQAEAKAMALRNEVAELLRTAEGVQKLRESDVLDLMKALVPAVRAAPMRSSSSSANKLMCSHIAVSVRSG